MTSYEGKRDLEVTLMQEGTPPEAKSDLFWGKKGLPQTLSQMTNFRLFQTEIVCRRQFQIWWKWQKVLQTGRKGKRRNCSLWAISPFSTVFSKDVYYRHVKTRACLGKGKSRKKLPLKQKKSAVARKTGTFTAAKISLTQKRTYKIKNV